MGLAGIIQNWEAPFWGQTQFSGNRPPGSSGSRSRPDNPAPAQTPGEALAYIERLYKAGRIQEVAGWLRRSQAFREAWQAIQQASQQYATAEAAIFALRSGGFSTGGQPQPGTTQPAPKTSLPVPYSPPSAPGSDAPSSPVLADYLLDSPLPAEKIYPAYPFPAPRPSRPLDQGYQVYEKSQGYVSPPPDLINVRV